MIFTVLILILLTNKNTIYVIIALALFLTLIYIPAYIHIIKKFKSHQLGLASKHSSIYTE